MSPADYVLLRLLFLSQLVLCLGQNCSFNCGSLGSIGYPFFRIERRSCGALIAMNCTASQPKARFGEEGKWYPVKYFDFRKRRMEIHDEDLQGQLVSNRCDLLGNFSRQEYLKSFIEEMSPSFLSFTITETRPFFRCKHNPNFPSTFFNQFDHFNCTDFDLYYTKNRSKHLPSLPANLSDSCSVIHLPSARVPDNDTGILKDNLTLHWGANFTIEWKQLQACVHCFGEGGVCQRPLHQSFQCIKKNIDMDGSGRKGARLAQKISIGATIGVAMLATLFFLVNYTKKNSGKLAVSEERVTTIAFEEFIKQQVLFSPKRYSFKEIQNMTQSFKNKLGQGGYGSVFKGVLNDGMLVAVKVLSEIKGNGEEFINEVASISRTSHVNIVSLLGYCFDGSKRALVYEFMPNGSLEKYIYDKDSSIQHPNLGWVILHDISVGIARGLEYLHRGCRTRILHFDIKPHNILLDKDFCPKISDFGLAKLCPRKDSIISMLGTRGTAGYIAPEVFCRNFGGISHKSDVYSYGMMLLEMVGGRKNITVAVDHTSEIYFPHWMHKRIKLKEDLGLHGIVSKEQENIPRKMILVGLWCIQTNPFDRPSMGRVLEMLEGSLEVLEIPPKPYLSSPSRVQGGSSID